VDAKWQGGLRAAFSPSWERIEDGETVLIALRTHRLDGKPASKSWKEVLHTDVMLVIASMTEDSISTAPRLGIVPFGDGSCSIKRSSSSQKVTAVEHYFSGHKHERPIKPYDDHIELDLHQTRSAEILEWLEIIFIDQE
jgi:hypothetical protein